jgi:hypothetical protein
MKNLYLALAIIGAVLPYDFFARHFAVDGLAVGGFLAAVFANSAAAGFTVDLLLSSFVFWIHLFASGQGARAWLLIPLNLAIGLSCALPAYFYLRARDSATAVAEPARVGV